MIDREELRRLCDAATPGPWKNYDDSQSTKRHEIVTWGRTVARIYCTAGQEARDVANAAFIAAARTAVPALLDALEAAEAREKRMREALAACEAWISDGGYACFGSGREVYEQAHKALAETAP